MRTAIVMKMHLTMTTAVSLRVSPRVNPRRATNQAQPAKYVYSPNIADLMYSTVALYMFVRGGACTVVRARWCVVVRARWCMHVHVFVHGGGAQWWCAVVRACACVSIGRTNAVAPVFIRSTRVIYAWSKKKNISDDTMKCLLAIIHDEWFDKSTLPPSHFLLHKAGLVHKIPPSDEFMIHNHH